MTRIDTDLYRPWVDGRVPSGYWDTRENRVTYIQWLGEQIGFVEIDDWYQIRARHWTKYLYCVERF